ncbi:hypothetical protein C6T62_07335 [Burkholderia multivorans]|nr:hypothetical protein C6T62_07335 [Burkholderia multivorans]
MVGVQPNPDRSTKATVRGGFFASARPGTRRDARIQRFVARKRSAKETLINSAWRSSLTRPRAL